jgi:multimeric flavodoxin WrbA
VSILKVLLVNGSPHEYGCTYTAFKDISNVLKNDDIESDFFWLGNKQYLSV